LSWVFNYGNSYSGGAAWVAFSQNSNIDFGFKTYYDPALEPPVAYAGPDQVILDGDCSGAYVTLDGSGSWDPNGDPLTYSWSWPGGSATGVSPTIMLPLGWTQVSLTVSDGLLSDTDWVWIRVKEPTPPEIVVISVSPDVLWPPNHQMVDVEVEATWSDNCDPNPWVSVSVSSSESVNNNGVGDGNTDVDWEVIDLTHFRLRAERAGVNSDRVYTITYTVTDASGNSASANITVTVPHDNR